MKAQKVTLTLRVEVLHIEAARALILQAVEKIDESYEGGGLRADDGDAITWDTERQEVTI